MVVVVNARVEVTVLMGHAVASWSTSTDPKPLAWSYPFAAEKPPVWLPQYVEPALQSLFPLGMSWNAEA
jgi:hypothetical protein